MSAIITLLQSAPTILSPNFIARPGENVLISGLEFKKDIVRIDIYTNDYYATSFGSGFRNVSGINNTLSDNVVGYTIPNSGYDYNNGENLEISLPGGRYTLEVSNTNGGVSTNQITGWIVQKPNVYYISHQSGALPYDYVRVSGYNLYPDPKVYFVDEFNNKTPALSIDSGIYKITGVEIISGGQFAFGDEYIPINESIEGFKLFNKNSQYSSGMLYVPSTGRGGTVGAIDILSSGEFTLFNTGIINLSFSGEYPELPQLYNYITGLQIRLLYSKSEYNNIYNDFIDIPNFLEVQVPPNLSKRQSILFENLKYKNNEGYLYTGFLVNGVPKIHTIDKKVVYANSGILIISGDNLDYVSTVRMGNINIPFAYTGDNRIAFIIPDLIESNPIFVSGQYGIDTSKDALNVLYWPLSASGFNPNDVLLQTGAHIKISGQYLHRINYVNIGTQNIQRNKLQVNSLGTELIFPLPDYVDQEEVYLYQKDYPGTGILVASSNTNDRLLTTSKLNPNFININYLSGFEAAKYLDDIEFYLSKSEGFNDYGLYDSDIFFTTPTGNIYFAESYIISGIKTFNNYTGIKIKLPREIKNPQSQIKIKRNKFKDEYILPFDKTINVLPSITYVSQSNTTFDNLGSVVISGINASNINMVYFSGYSGTKNILGFKDINITDVSIIEKDLFNLTGNKERQSTAYSKISTEIGGDIYGSGKVFLWNTFFNTGLGYEHHILSNDSVRILPLSGFKPPNSDIFTSPAYVYSPLDEPFFYAITTNSRASKFSFEHTNLNGIDYGDAPPSQEGWKINSANQLQGVPTSGGTFYFKIKAIDGDRPNEGMILWANFGVSGRSLTGPGVVYRGDFDPDKKYVGNNLRRDIVKHKVQNTQYWYAAFSSSGSYPALGNPNWLPFTNEFGSTATQLFLSESSNITNDLNIGQEGLYSGYIKTPNDINIDEGSGFYLGYDNRYNVNRPKFRVGNEFNYIKFDGLGLDVVGPLSGVVTTSKDIDSRNIVNSSFAVALGEANSILGISNNALACGSTNFLSGARRSAILGGKNNIITKLQAFEANDSTIVGGSNNLIIGAYCNIAGGAMNKIDASQTGLSSIADQVFITPLTGTGSAIGQGRTNFEIIYPQEIFTNKLAIFNNINIFKNEVYIDKYYPIQTSGYVIGLNSGLYQNQKFNVHSWVSLTSPNLFSGSFENKTNNQICEFKVLKSGFEKGLTVYPILFTKPFSDSTLNNLSISILSNIYIESGDNEGQSMLEKYTIQNLNLTGFEVRFTGILNEDVIGNFFIGETGFFSGLEFNVAKKLEVGKIHPLQNLYVGDDVDFNIGVPTGTKISFLEINRPYSNNFYLNSITETLPSELKFKLSKDIEDEFLYVDFLGYTGFFTGNHSPDPNTYKYQVFTVSLPRGYQTHNVDLPAPFPGNYGDNYAVIINQISGNDNYYHYNITGRDSNRFKINFTDQLVEDAYFNIGIYKTGVYIEDSIKYDVRIYDITGTSTSTGLYDIPYGDYPSAVFSTVENVNSDNHYISHIHSYNQTGFKIALSKPLDNSERIRLHLVTVRNTGIYTRTALNRFTIADKDLKISGYFDIPLRNDTLKKYTLFANAYTNNPASPYVRRVFKTNLFKYREQDFYSITLTGVNPVQQLSGLIIDYVATDMELDKNIAKVVLEDYDYARLASLGFEDVGSNTVAGGTGNYIKGVVSNIAGGTVNSIFGDFNTIAGGRSNKVIDSIEQETKYPQVAFSNIVGGYSNTISGNIQFSNILGGSGNYIYNANKNINRISSSILAGTNNIVSGSYSYVLGRNVSNYKDGASIITDSTTGIKNTFQDNTMILFFSGGVYITGNAANISPIVLDVTKLPQHTNTSSLPVGGIFRSGNYLMIKN